MSSSSSNPPPAGAPKAPAPSGGKGKDFARMSAAAAAAAASSTTPVVAAAPPPTAESPTPVKKGKDLSRMAASAPPSAVSFVASQDAPCSDATPVGKPKGKDLSRMGSVQRSSPGSAAGQGAAAAAAAAGNSGAPSGGVSLGKDLANMPRPPTLQSPTQHTNAPTTVQVKSLAPAPTNLSSAADIAEHQRRQSVARAAAGLDAVKPAADLPTIQGPSKNVSPENEPTTRPSWSEAALSAASSLRGANDATAETSSKSAAATTTTTTATTTTKKYGDPSLAPILGTKLQNLCRSIDPSYVLDSQVQESLLEMADSFLDKVTSDAIRLARHRGAKTLDVVDVALALKKGYGMEVAGLGAPSHPQSGVGATASGRKNHWIGGWLFAEKLNPSREGEKRGRKKQKQV